MRIATSHSTSAVSANDVYVNQEWFFEQNFLKNNLRSKEKAITPKTMLRKLVRNAGKPIIPKKYDNRYIDRQLKIVSDNLLKKFILPILSKQKSSIFNGENFLFLSH